MTRASLVSRNDYTGTDAVSTYSYTFQIALSTDLLVTEELISTGAQTTLAITTDYTVTGVGDVGGGTIVLVAGNLASTKNLTIRRVVPLTQNADIRNQGTYFPETQENAFDKLNDQNQQQGDEVDRSLKYAETVDTSTVNGDIIGPLVAAYHPRLNATLDGMEWAASVDGSNISLPAGLAYMVQTAAGVFTARTITKTGNLLLTNGDGQAGNTNIDSSTIDTNITTVQTNLDTSNKSGKSSANVRVNVTSTTQAVVYTGTRFRGIDTGDWFEFASDKTFDITTTGAGGLNTGAEATSTIYYLVAIGSTTAANPPHVIGVTEANWATFTASDVPTGWDDYKRLPPIYNDSGGDLEIYNYVNDKGFYKDSTFMGLSTASATFVDIDVSPFLPAAIRELDVIFFNTSATTAIWRSKLMAGVGVPISNASTILYEEFSVLLSLAGIFELKTSAGTLSARVPAFIDDLEDEDQ